VEQALGIKDCKTIFMYDKWGWNSYQGESTAIDIETEIDKLLREGVAGQIGKDKGGDIHAHKFRDEECRGCNTEMK
jgi:hypothetical protein